MKDIQKSYLKTGDKKTHFSIFDVSHCHTAAILQNADCSGTLQTRETTMVCQRQHFAF